MPLIFRDTRRAGRNAGTLAINSYLRRALLIAAIVTSFGGCAYGNGALKPSEILARENEFDGKRVHVTGWIAGRCIWDSKAHFEHDIHDANKIEKYSLSLFGMPDNVAVLLENHVGEIDGVFYIDVARGRVSDMMCTFAGIDMGASP